MGRASRLKRERRLARGRATGVPVQVGEVASSLDVECWALAEIFVPLGAEGETRRFRYRVQEAVLHELGPWTVFSFERDPGRHFVHELSTGLYVTSVEGSRSDAVAAARGLFRRAAQWMMKAQVDAAGPVLAQEEIEREHAVEILRRSGQ